MKNQIQKTHEQNDFRVWIDEYSSIPESLFRNVVEAKGLAVLVRTATIKNPYIEENFIDKLNKEINEKDIKSKLMSDYFFRQF